MKIEKRFEASASPFSRLVSTVLLYLCRPKRMRRNDNFEATQAKNIWLLEISIRYWLQVENLKKGEKKIPKKEKLKLKNVRIEATDT